MSEVTFGAVTADTVWLSYYAHHTTLQSPCHHLILIQTKHLEVFQVEPSSVDLRMARVWQSKHTRQEKHQVWNS